MHGLLLLLYSLLLLLLELILPGLKLCKCSSGLLSLTSLILSHPLKYRKYSRICLWCRWS